jgi:Fe-S cluster assembly protein SufD
MSNAAALPTWRDEDYRYADLKALARVWPTLDAPERVDVAAGEAGSMLIDALSPVDGVAVRAIDVHIGEGARFDLFALVSGADYGRLAITATLAKGAHFEMGGAILGGGEQTLEIVSTIRHAEPDATSHQVVRSVLAGRATGSFLGRIEVARDAQRTDAEQSVKAMLLDRTATANARPELEIFADDVKCAHGATVGELDKSAMFYLASRGLPPVSARALLLQAFIADAFVGMADDAARDAIEAKARAAMEGLS